MPSSVFTHVVPPFVERHTPTLDATCTVAFVVPADCGSTSTFAIVAPPVGVSQIVAPRRVHVLPPSVERSTPQP